MQTNGKMARMLGIDPKTLRKWARRGYVRSYINRVNGYRYYFKAEVIEDIKKVPGSKKAQVDQRPGSR
jgi:DNA-binding transcriptional MerR regulator